MHIKKEQESTHDIQDIKKVMLNVSQFNFKQFSLDNSLGYQT